MTKLVCITFTSYVYNFNVHVFVFMDTLLQHFFYKKNHPFINLHDEIQKELWEKGARQSLRGALTKMGIRKLKPRSKPKLAGDGDGNGEGKSESNFWKRASETNMLIATLIATVSFTAAFTVLGGYNQNGSVHEGLAELRKTSAFRVFLIANTLAFALSTTSVFLHFLASATVEEVVFHKKVARRHDVPLFSQIGLLEHCW